MRGKENLPQTPNWLPLSAKGPLRGNKEEVLMEQGPRWTTLSKAHKRVMSLLIILKKFLKQKPKDGEETELELKV